MKDPFDIIHWGDIPANAVYQWCRQDNSLSGFLAEGWYFVPFTRHACLLRSLGRRSKYLGAGNKICYAGMVLMEQLKIKFESSRKRDLEAVEQFNDYGRALLDNAAWDAGGEARVMSTPLPIYSKMPLP